MDKQQLVRIILKDLEEIKILAKEVADSEKDSASLIELAVNRGRLICQELEILHDFCGSKKRIQEEPEEDEIGDEEDEIADISASDPEFEILNFDNSKIPQTEPEVAEKEFAEVTPAEQIEEEEPELQEENEEEPESVELEEDLIEETETEPANPQEETVPEYPEDDEDDDDYDEDYDEAEDEVLTEIATGEPEDEDEPVIDDEDFNEVEVKEAQPEIKIQAPEQKKEHQAGVREIQIDDLDDDELEPVQFSPLSDSTSHTVMHEIPKPENPVQAKTVIGESFQKERSLNDAMGDNKTSEPKLTNGPISSLRAAIGLNDRFFFIREIFDNNTDKYNSVIEHLDKLETIQEAVEYLKSNLSLQKSNTSLKFVDLLKRRFSK